MREANRNSKVPKFIRRIEMVQKRSIMYYQQQSSHPFLKIVVALPTMVASCRGKKCYLCSFGSWIVFFCFFEFPLFGKWICSVSIWCNPLRTFLVLLNLL